MEHRLIAEKALGKILRRTAPVHHANEDPSNNANSNLVICNSPSYHRLLHARARIQRRGGNPNTDKICATCKAVKPKSKFSAGRHSYDGLDAACRDCSRLRGARYRYERKSA